MSDGIDEQLIRKKALLDYVSLQRYRDNLHAEQLAKEFIEDFQDTERKQGEKRKEIATSFHDTLRHGLDPLGKVEIRIKGDTDYNRMHQFCRSCGDYIRNIDTHICDVRITDDADN